MRRILLILIACTLFVSCVAERDGSVLSVATAQEPPTLDVMVSSSVSGRNIAVGNVYERLLSIDEDGNIVPCLASAYELMDAGHTLVLTLQQDVHFHDGSVLTPEDVVSSLNRWLSVYSNTRKITGESMFHAEGNNIVIEASSSLALLPLMLASSPQAAVVLPASSVSSLTDNGLVIDAPGTGPYVLAEWATGAYIELKAFDEYWGDKPEIDEIRYNFVSDPVTRRLGLESGQYDFIDMVSSDDVPSLEKNSSIELHEGGETGSIVIVFNKKEGISRDQDFRRAISLLIDREELMRSCYGDYGFSLHSDYMENGKWSVDSSLDVYGREDEELATKFLDASSYEGKGVRILSSNLSNIDKIAITLSSELEKEGINTEIIIMDWASFMEKRRDPSSWDIYVSAASSVVLPVEKGYLFATSPGGFDDKELSSMISELASSSSIEDAVEIWKRAQIGLWEYVPVIIPGHYATVYASSSSLHDIDFTDGYHFRNAFLD